MTTRHLHSGFQDLFCTLALATAALLLTAIGAGAQGTAPAPSSRGVFFEPGQAPRYRELFTGNALFATLRKQMDTIDRARERRWMRSGVRTNDQLYDIARVGDLAQQMSLLYLYTGDTDAADLARECVETLMRFPRWDYFLEGGTDVIGLQRAPNSAIAVALTVEALGDRVPAAVRTRWLTVMGERGTEPCFRATYGMRYPDRVKGWSMDTTSTYFTHRPLERGLSLARWPIILNTINLKAIPASALALSALIYRAHMGETADTKRWLEQAVYSIGTFRDIYARDGSYSEGVGYAHYTTLHIIQAVDALRRAGVADLTDMLNWNGYQDYLVEMTQPTREEPRSIVNFSDAGGGANSGPSFWIARQTRDGLARWFGENLALAHDMWSVVFYDPSVPLQPPRQEPRLWESDLGWIVGRTGYQPDDLVVAMRSGGPYNHEHADRNEVIVKCFGEKLIVDPMRPPYSWRDPAWKMRLTTGHSCLLIDGQGHQYVDGHEGTNASQATAVIIRKGERDGLFFWTSDATDAYRLVHADVRSVTRTVVMLNELPAVVLIDKVIKVSQPSKVQARFYGYNNDGKGTVAAGQDSFTITRPFARLTAVAASNSGVAFSTAIPDIPPAQAKLYPYVDVGTTEAATEICLVTVLVPSAQGGQAAGAQSAKAASGRTARIDRQGQDHLVRISAGARTTTIRVIDSGAVPEFEVAAR